MDVSSILHSLAHIRDNEFENLFTYVPEPETYTTTQDENCVVMRGFFKQTLRILNALMDPELAPEGYRMLIDKFNEINAVIQQMFDDNNDDFGPDADGAAFYEIHIVYKEIQKLLAKILDAHHLATQTASIQHATSFRGLRPSVDPVAPDADDASLRRYVAYNADSAINFDPDMAHYILNPNRSKQSVALQQTYLIPVNPAINQEWLLRQTGYIRKLSARDRYILRGYTHHGDVLVNGYCRGNLSEDISDLMATYAKRLVSNPFLAYLLYDQYDTFKGPLTLPPKALLTKLPSGLFTKDTIMFMRTMMLGNLEFFGQSRNILTLLEQFKQELIRIIGAAPRRRTPITVYRGFKHEDHITCSSFINRDFMSSSLSISTALNFSEVSKANYAEEFSATRYYGGVYEITLAANVPALYIDIVSEHRGEIEILLPPGLSINMDKTVFNKILPNPNTIVETSYPYGNAFLALRESPRHKVAVVHVHVDTRMDTRAKSTRKNSEATNRAKMRRQTRTAKNVRRQRTLNMLDES